ncbi:F-box protein skip16 [Dinochytrium kinnereticum]|nr:F-box protein skip16 [Dinochytrium kinnereticum]
MSPLPATEVLLHITTFVDSPFDVARLSAVSKAWRIAACDASIWRRFCLEYECLPHDDDLQSAHGGLAPTLSSSSSASHGSVRVHHGLTHNPQPSEDDGDTMPPPPSVTEQPNSNSSSSSSSPSPHRIFCTHAQTYGTLLSPFSKMKRITRRLNSLLGHLPSLARFRPAAVDLGPHPIYRPEHLMDHRTWFPDSRVAEESEKSLALLYHLFSSGQVKVINNSGARAADVGYGIFGSFRCYGQLYSMYMLPRSHLIRVILNGTFCGEDEDEDDSHTPQDEGDRAREQVAVVMFAESTMLEFLGLVVPVARYTSSPGPGAPKIGHVIRFGLSKNFNRMGPIPRGRIPYVDLGPFDDWIHRFVDEVAASVEAPSYRRIGATTVFASEGRGTASQVTDGVLLSISSIFLLDTAKVCYRISMTYLPGQCPYPSIQLLRRHWLFTSKSGTVDEVSGEGVIGAFPVLSQSNPHFQYCSYSMGGPVDYAPFELDDPLVSMEGDILFIDTASAHSPDPQYLSVRVPKVEFVLPDCI